MEKYRKWLIIGGGALVAVVLAVVVTLYALGAKHGGTVLDRIAGGLDEVGSGVVPDNALARRFRDCAGRANQLIAQAADEVYFLVSGIPMRVKPKEGNDGGL